MSSSEIPRPPVVALSGLSEIRMTVGTVFEDPGGLALDDVDGALAIQVEGRVDAATPGNYILTIQRGIFPGTFRCRWCVW